MNVIDTTSSLQMVEEDCRRKDVYLSSFVHEIKTPLNTIAGFSQLLKETSRSDENWHKYLEIILSTTENLASLVSKFSEVAEIEAGMVNLFVNQIDLSLLVARVRKDFDPMFRSRNLSFEVTSSVAEKDKIFNSDEIKLYQAISILLTNAIENTYSGKITMEIIRNSDVLQFNIRDTGLGIPSSLKADLFDYSRLNKSIIERAKGSGLGLIIAKSYAGMMGGTLKFESEEGKGSVFCLSVQNLQHPEETEKVRPGTTSTAGENKLKKTLVVAEDDKFNFMLIKTLLQNENLIILHAENGKEAVDICEKEKVDLILMDIRMPVMDGYTATRLIKEKNPDLKIIAQTAYSNDRSIAVSNGCIDFISKPFSKDQLLLMIRSYI